MPSFSSCKGIGDAAIEEIIRLRNKQKGKVFSSLDSILFDKDKKWQVSKFNKKAMEGLIHIKAFESVGIVGKGKQFQNYNHMEKALIPGWSKWKKRLKSDPLRGYNEMNESILLEYDTPPYSRKQIIENEMNHLGAVTIDTVIPPRYARVFHEKNFIPIDEYEDPTEAYWWIVVKAVKKKTKRGAHYLRLRVMGANGKQEWMNCWGWNGEEPVDPYTVCVGIVSSNHYGKSTKWSKMRIFLG